MKGLILLFLLFFISKAGAQTPALVIADKALLAKAKFRKRELREQLHLSK